MDHSKSILMRSSTAASLKGGRGATPLSAQAKHTRNRKRVEIEPLLQSEGTNEDGTAPKPRVFKETPLPRVALLSTKSSKRSLTRKESSRIALKLKSTRLRAKGSPTIPSYKSKSRNGRKGSKSDVVESAKEEEMKNKELREDKPANKDIAKTEGLKGNKYSTTRKRLALKDDENKILDSYATYMKINGNRRPTGIDSELAQFLMKNI